MDRYLVIANQTLGGEALDQAIHECLDQGSCSFYVLVPKTKIEYEVGWGGGFDVHVPTEVRRQIDEKSVRRFEARSAVEELRAQHRLEQMIARIALVGGQADGEVGTDDPLAAIQSVLARQGDFNGIFVSTLPARFSRWLKMDIPSRLTRLTEIPVTVVEAGE